MGLDPKDVDRIADLQRLPEHNQTMIRATLLQGILSMDKMDDDELRDFLMLVRASSAEQRASTLLRTMSQPLFTICADEIASSGMDVAVGVMPMRWFNGQSSPYLGNAMCLASTGSLDLIEIFCILFMARLKDPQYALIHMRAAVDTYLKTGSVKPAEFGLAEGLHDFSDYKGKNGVAVGMTTAAEQFLVAHELGHVSLGHLSRATLGAVPCTRPTGKPSLLSRIAWRAPAKECVTVQVIQPSHMDEYCADQWAFHTMLRAALLPDEKGREPLYCAGATIFLGLAMIIEAASRAAGMTIPDTHPSALNRLYLVQLATELHGFHENAYIARRVCEFIEEIGASYLGFEMPPMLSRDLNQVALKVFSEMSYNLDGATYITDFV